MQDSLPAGWLAFTGRELNPLDHYERFPSCYISSPFPGFILTLPWRFSDACCRYSWLPSSCSVRETLYGAIFVKGCAKGPIPFSSLCFFVRVRRETGKKQGVQVPHGEGVATHIDPESCAVSRESIGEALTGERIGQPSNRGSAG